VAKSTGRRHSNAYYAEEVQSKSEVEAV
jgi:hypothetical protein